MTGRRIGVCSWSLRPHGPEELAKAVRACGVGGVQLALDPLRRREWPLDACVEALERARVAALSGMMATRGEDYSTPASIRRTGGLLPDEHWSANLAAARENAWIARRLGIGLVSLHAGFLPEKKGAPERRTMLERLRAVVDAFAAEGVRTALETGQERAETLLEVLADLDRPEAGVNFDPANMLLYDMGDPVEALSTLAPHVLQVHVKDARRPRAPGEWGEEVPVGAGEVNWHRFFDVIAGRGIECDLVIERESGEERTADVARARELVLAQLGRIA